MDEVQEKKFEEWWNGPWCRSTLYFLRSEEERISKAAWEACLEANKAEEQEPEPSPTEMVKRLLEEGWEVIETDNDSGFVYFVYKDFRADSIRSAYRKAFPPKKRIEVEVWDHQHKGEWVACTHSLRTGWVGDDKGNMSTPESLLEAGWVKGIATFWVEDK